MKKKERKTAGEIQNKLLKDEAKYDALEVGHAIAEEIYPQLLESIKIYRDRIDEPEFCVVMVIADDPLLCTVKRRKFYCWPFLPSPRPNQAVFLYNKAKDQLTKRLWVLPAAQVMAELSCMSTVDKQYELMQAWSVAFFRGTFWEFIRYQHDIKMLSEHEHHELLRKEFRKSGVNLTEPVAPDPFDFCKIAINNIVDTKKAEPDQNGLGLGRQTEDFYRRVSAH